MDVNTQAARIMTINQIIALAVKGGQLPDHEAPVRSGLNACDFAQKLRDEANKGL